MALPVLKCRLQVFDALSPSLAAASCFIHTPTTPPDVRCVGPRVSYARPVHEGVTPNLTIQFLLAKCLKNAAAIRPCLHASGHRPHAGCCTIPTAGGQALGTGEVPCPLLGRVHCNPEPGPVHLSTESKGSPPAQQRPQGAQTQKQGTSSTTSIQPQRTVTGLIFVALLPSVHSSRALVCSLSPNASQWGLHWVFRSTIQQHYPIGSSTGTHGTKGVKHMTGCRSVASPWLSPSAIVQAQQSETHSLSHICFLATFVPKALRTCCSVLTPQTASTPPAPSTPSWPLHRCCPLLASAQP